MYASADTSKTTPLAEILEERGESYGDWRDQSNLAQDMKTPCHDHPNWHKLKPYQRECVDMILLKISRAVNGDPMKLDTWQDIEGYASITVGRMEQDLEKNK